MTDDGTPLPRRLLFVCMGNICRSPTAHGVMRHKLRVAGPDGAIEVDSAGTHGWHEGDPPDERAIAHAHRRGYDIADLRARPLRPADFERFDLLLVMDGANRAAARRIGPAVQHGNLRLLTAYGLVHHAAEVPDPYYGGDAGFEHVLDGVEDACDGLLRRLVEELRPR
ncbi:MAG: low molecular weight phosphotyrosine protein phosphatase [Burkholderiales bacterium]|nr:low molecular weight phosphotyrosine protein phosphatase [Burkholderiales bacterium]